METQVRPSTNRKRRHPRFERCLDFDLGPHMRAKTLDISEGGFSAAMLNQFEPGQVLKGCFNLAGERVAFEAQVRWSIDRTRFGASFLKVDPRVRTFLQNMALH